MKLIILALTLTTNALASGVVTIYPKLDLESKKIFPQARLDVSENLLWNVWFYESSLGVSSAQIATEQGFRFSLGKWSLNPSYELKWAFKEGLGHAAELGISRQLW